MKKLIELLNEYEYSTFENKKLATERGDIQDGVVFEKDFCTDLGNLRERTMDVTHLISKKYGFIKWLVDNDKIETNNLSLKAFKTIFGGNGFIEVSDLECLLMLLSISDSPIDDLVGYLK